MKKHIILGTLLAVVVSGSVQANVLTDAFEKVKEGAQAVVNKVKEVAQDVRQSSAVQSVANKAHGLAQKTKELADQAGTALKSGMSQAAQNVKKEAKAGFALVKHKAQKLKNSFSKEKSKAANDVKKGLDDIVEHAEKGLDTIEKAQ